MSYAKKTNSFRRITVDGAVYRWRFRFAEHDSTMTLQGTESSGQQAIVTMRGVRDPWLNFPAPDVKLVTITARIARRMIQQALARGWKPTERIAPFTFDHEPEHETAHPCAISQAQFPRSDCKSQPSLDRIVEPDSLSKKRRKR
ncbi:hypothetical protein [Roseimicrobium sp. ORNL1]|uniref:hypothetical protein n=1 Tax=Roseimicrobium sp. ORNL1 TaxID=2711231 RepID=UPI0013E0FF2D|nr:hypothetical protein [Roseimicrobium sp. ORNL1]QIF02482.1 hypothetical protein G5S37_13415 [Roseimicrobium sp. ORNL1]